MSKDIRSFFKVADVKKKSEDAKKSKRKADNFCGSDDEKEPSKHDVKKKRRVIESDDEDEKPKIAEKKKTPVKKLVEVDVSSMFGSEPVKRKERPKVAKKVETIYLDDDEDAIDHDISLMIDDIDKQEALVKLTSPVSSSKPKPPAELPLKLSPEVKQSSSSEKRKSDSESRTPTSKKAKPAPKSSSKKEKVKQVKETTVEEDEARHERRQAAAVLYHKFANRATVLNHGCKEIPKGKPDCLKGCQFVISGILESMEREEAVDLIKSCGGNVVSALSKKVTHLLVGEEAGPAKLAKAESMKILQMTEDELLNTIREKSGLKVASVEVKVELVGDSPGKENQKAINGDTVKIEEKSPPAKQSPQKSTSSSPKAVKIKPEPAQSSSTQIVVAAPKNMNDFSFVDKYKPTSVQNIIGQQGPSGNATKLMNWLAKWHTNHDGKKKHAKPNPWAKDNDGSAYKAALLSGSPGVGKTTTAHLVAQELMFDIVEFNASDTRSKKLLKEEVSSLLSNKSLAGYLNGSDTKVSKRHVLIMDEVDGMAGNEDRGGVGELIALIKDSHIPIICMCNDRNHQKIRSLANHCFDLRFHKPSTAQVRGAMMSICFKEGIKLEAGALDEIIGGTGNDIRQTLNHLALYSASKDVKLGLSDAKKNAHMSEKDTKTSPFEAIRKVFSAEDHKKMTFNDKSDLFFNDYNMAPLFVQENYLRVKPNCEKSQLMKRVAKTADSLSLGDLVEKRIRSNMAWSLLPVQAVFSSILPGEYMEGVLTSASNFPGWLGKNSRSNKRKRLAQEVHDHTRMSTSGSRLSVRLDYAQFLVQAIVTPLKEKGLEGVPQALNVIKEYRLLREDIDSLIELASWPKMKNPWDSIESKVKAALTRAYNKEVQPYSYSVQTGVKKKAARAAIDDDMEGFENEEEGSTQQSDEEDEDSLENNALVKVKKSTTAKDASSKAGTSKASTSGASSSKPSKAVKPRSKK